MAKILIVDDDVTITGLMEALMMMQGHQPTIVNDSLKAVAVADSMHPDLITLDLMMLGLTGFELCKRSRKNPTYAGIPILIISARTDDRSRAVAFALGANDYITKPFDVDDFLKYLKKLLHEKRLGLFHVE